SSGMWRTAAMASRFSVRLTGSPASRSSWMNPASSDSIGWPVVGSTGSATGASSATRRGTAPLPRLPVRCELLHRLCDVALILEQDVDRGGRLVCVDVLDAEQHERAGPVERLGHGRRLLQLELADRAHDARHLFGEVLGDVGNLRQHDLFLAIEIGIVDVE